jgi:hypothetical protein
MSTRLDGRAKWSLILGVLSLVGSFLCIGLFFGPYAILLGFWSRQHIAATAQLGSHRIAVAGILLGIVGFLASVGWVILFVIAMNSEGQCRPAECFSPP